MSEVRSTIPFDSSKGLYRKTWQTSQAEQVFKSNQTIAAYYRMLMMT
jgi:hypothetical protein